MSVSTAFEKELISRLKAGNPVSISRRTYFGEHYDTAMESVSVLTAEGGLNEVQKMERALDVCCEELETGPLYSWNAKNHASGRRLLYEFHPSEETRSLLLKNPRVNGNGSWVLERAVEDLQSGQFSEVVNMETPDGRETTLDYHRGFFRVRDPVSREEFAYLRLEDSLREFENMLLAPRDLARMILTHF